MKNRRRYAAIAAAPVVLLASVPAAAQERVPPVDWQQSPIIFQPGKIEGGERQFAEGESIVEFPLRWMMSTRLASDVVLRRGDESYTMAAGTLLPLAMIRPYQGAGPRIVYCTRSRVAERKEGSGFMGAMFGNWFNSLQDKQVCLEDSDEDKSLDRALVLGDGPGIVDLGAIEPLAFEALVAEPMGTPDDLARVTMTRVGRSVVQLQLDIIQTGEARSFSTMQSGRFRASRFTDIRFSGRNSGPLDQFGVLYEVVDAQTKENSATLRWTPRAGAEEFVLVPDNVTTTYGW